jgi:hypothetical protein
MRRIAWVLLAVICATFVQVQPLGTLKAPTCRCDHCKAPGSCGMPGCAQSACPAGPVATMAAEPSRAPAAVARRERPARPARTEWFLVPASPHFIPILPVAATYAGGGPRVPLFRAHCSLLI